MTHKEKIVKILRNKKQILFETKALAVWGIDSADYGTIADEILALPIEVPTDAEIETWAHKTSLSEITARAKIEGYKKAIEEIKKLNS